MKNPLAPCELAARASNISAGHFPKQAWLLNARIFILGCSWSCAEVRSPNLLKQPKSALDHPFHSIYVETENLSSEL